MNAEDRELLELAAKAAGYHLINLDGVFVVDAKRWSPLTDDGDALRLAMKCEISLDFYCNADTVQAFLRGECGEIINVHIEQWSEAGTRRAIVRAAAEIGKAMP